MSNQSAGQIVLGGIGAVIGAFAGNPYLGYQIGSMAGGLIFPGQLPDGPRINDFQLGSSTYGIALPKGYGVNRVAGNLIWADKVVHTGRSVNVGKKASQNVDAVTQSFAVSFGEGSATHTLLRLWLDNKIVYDISRGPLPAGELDLSDLGEGDLQPSEFLRQFINRFFLTGAGEFFPLAFYPGSETQERDPTMVEVDGEENTPAYRGECYAVLKSLELAQWGNRLPTVTAEIASAASDAFPKTGWTLAEDCSLDEVQLDGVAWDPARGVLYERDPGGLRVFSYPALVESCYVDQCGIPPYRLRGVSPSGHLYVDLYEHDETPVWLLDPDTFDVAGRQSILLPGSPSAFLEARYLGFLQDRFGQVFTVVCAGISEHVAVLQEKYLLEPADGVDALIFTGSLDAGFNAVGACNGQKREGWTEFYVLGQTATELRIYLGKIYSVAAGGIQSSATLELVEAFDLATVFPEAAAAPGTAFARVVGYDEVTHSFVLLIENPDLGYYFACYSAPLGDWRFRVWNAVAGGVSFDPSYNISDVSGRTFAVGKGTSGSPQSGAFYLHSFIGGGITNTLPWASYDPTTQVTVNQQFWDSKLQAIYISDDLQGNDAGLCYLGRLAGDVITLAEIVADICRRCGLDDSQFDVSELTDLVHGYLVTTTTTGRGMLEPLMVAYSFDAVESDYKIKFVKRGGAAIATIPQDDLAAMDADNNALVQQRTQEIDLPEAVVINFIDYTRDYLRGTQSSRRIALPTPTQFSRNTLNIELAIAMSPSRARRIADQKLYEAWGGRDSFNFKTGWKYLALDPADVVNVEADDDTTLRTRLNVGNTGADYSGEFTGQSEDETIYDPVEHEVAGGAGAEPTYGPGGRSQVQAITLDATLLNDFDDSGGGVTKYYEALKPLQPDNFSGGAVLRSTDNATFTPRTVLEAAPAQGKLLTALAGDVSAFTIHDEDYFDVLMHYGDAPESVSNTDFFAGKNTAAIRRNDGEVEWVQFRDVEDLGDGKVRCSYLLRGRRGSEVFMRRHQVGDLVVFLKAGEANAGIGMDNIDLGSINRTLYFAGGAVGQTLADVNKEVNTISGNDLKPYAPVHLSAVGGGSPAGITLGWVRRTRLGGGWRDETATVPLAEARERYKVQILDADGAEILRTIESIDDAEYLYSEAMQLEDFGSTISADDLIYRVCQVSAAVGDGFWSTYPSQDASALPATGSEATGAAFFTVSPSGPIAFTRPGSVTLTITNTGDATGAPTTELIPVSGEGISIDFSECASLRPGESCLVTVTYAPTESGASNATILVTGGVQAPVRICLTGEIVGPYLVFITPALNCYDLDFFDFTSVSNLVVKNIGSDPAIPENVTEQILGGFPVELTGVNFDSPAPINPGDTRIVFFHTPTDPDPGSSVTIEVRVESNSVAGDTVACVFFHRGLPIIVVDPSSVDFGTVPEAGGSSIRSVGVRNIGDAPAFPRNWSVGSQFQGPGANFYAFEGPPQIDPGQLITLVLDFEPSVSGSVVQDFTFDWDLGSFRIPLHGISV